MNTPRQTTIFAPFPSLPAVHSPPGRVVRDQDLKDRKAARDRNEREAKELETALTQTYAGR